MDSHKQVSKQLTNYTYLSVNHQIISALPKPLHGPSLLSVFSPLFSAAPFVL